MKKYLLFAIVSFFAFSLVSCSYEKGSLDDGFNNSKLTVTLGEGTKATMINPTANNGAGFSFQSGDVINWISNSGNATYTYTGEDSNLITFDMEIPGLATGDVEGYFAVNFTDEVPYCFNASNTTQAQAGINSNCFFLSSYTKTLPQGSTSVSIDVKPVGGVFAFQFKGEGDKVFKVEVGAENTWCNNASFDGYALVVDPIMSKLATNVDVEMSNAYDTQCIFVPVPAGVTLDEPYVKIYAQSGMYSYDFGGTAVAPGGDLTFEDGVIMKVKLPLNKSLCDTFEEWPGGTINLTDPGKVTGITLDKSEANAYIGSAISLTPTISPETADVTDVVWISSDPSIATVSGGSVTAVAVGTATITAKTVDGGFTASCDVTCAEPIACMVFTVGEQTSEMQLLCAGSKRIKWNRHAYTSTGNWGGYLEIVQNDTSYYLADASKVQSLSNILGVVVAEATDLAGEDAVIPCSGQSGTLFCWITDDGGWLKAPKVIAADTEMEFESSWDWSGATAGVTSTLTKGSKYLSIIYSVTSNSGKWKVFEVSETKPE